MRVHSDSQTSGSLSQSESQYDTPKVELSGDVSASLVVPLVKLVVDSGDQVFFIAAHDEPSPRSPDVNCARHPKVNSTRLTLRTKLVIALIGRCSGRGRRLVTATGDVMELPIDGPTTVFQKDLVLTATSMSCGVTDPFIAKQRLAILSSVLVAILCQQHVHSMSVMKTSQWQKSNSKILSNSMPVTARSKVECAALCLRHTRCFRFCHNPDTLACIHGHGATSGSGEDYDDNSTCYDKVTKECSASGGYDLYTGRCLTLSSPLVMYHEAQDQCAAQGGHLVYYKSLTEDERPLADLLTHAAIDSQSCVWVGADTIGRNQSFRWNDGTALPASSEVWLPWEPNNLGGVEECVCLVDLRLNDISCGSKLPFVCEIDV
ncbi:hypothetical protein C0Q70_14578 [Pomacea canaliculata]|uniref:C-type lectin domain-containing protein n=1 Tax=Pomacea canaliculata TaxID=400727 RepID=A0A2T7NSH6_POMCA|nr:hypothetical protein C0Q70_14578 [Pomacea canaliculata]